MKTIILQTDAQSDLDLLIAFAQRLGIQCFEADSDLDIAASTPITTHHTATEVPDSSALYEGLGLDEEVEVYDLLDLQVSGEDDLYSTSYEDDFENAKKYFGVWKDDQEETLEDLLDMLTP
jgi:hypothetical protein